MGWGSWDSNTYDRVTKSKIDSGTTFSYTSSSMRSGHYKAHDSLDVMGPKTRESRDSTDHPESTPIVIGFDVTGSMGENPEIIQKSLKELFGMLVRQDIVSDPQVAIAAYGDLWCDRVPIQFGQFESDNRIDDELDNVFIEGGGGGNNGESSAVIPYYVANHVKTDAWDKRGKRGYLFLIGDERANGLKRTELHDFLGEEVQGDVSAEDAYKVASERWNVYFLLIDNWAARYQHSSEQYSSMLGKDHVIKLQDASAAASTISALIALNEETATSDTIGTELAKAGFSDEIVAQTQKAIGVYGSRKGDIVSTEYADLGL